MRRRPIAPKVLLAALPLFKSLDEPTLARLAQRVERRPLQRGERLFRHDDPIPGMFVVVHGAIRLVKPGVRGERLLATVGAGRSFGEPLMFLERPALVDAVAASDALVLLVPKEVVFAEIERNPRFARLMLANLSERAEALVHELDRQALGSGRARLADYLSRQAMPAPGAQVITLEAPKAAIAARLHVTAAHFSRLLREFEAAGLLRVEGRRIVVPDVARLAGLATHVPT